MSQSTQAVLLTLVGAFAIRLGVTDAHLVYVRDWTRWPLVASGLVLVLLAFGHFVDSFAAARQGQADGEPAPDDGAHPEHAEHRAPRTTWLLFVPVAVILLVSPPALGAYLAERAATSTTTVVPPGEASGLRPLTGKEPIRLAVSEFFVRAVYDGGHSLEGRRVEMTGFVSFDTDHHWYVTRFGITCCAADAAVVRVRASGVDAPERDEWVRVVGTWVAGSGVGPRGGPPEIEVAELTAVEPPANPYE